MSERYTRLYVLPERLYIEEAPIIIMAGALHMDNKLGKCVAQLKFKNISNQLIIAVRVRIMPYDVANRPLEGATEHQYLDLFASRDEEFGQKTLVSLSDSATRSFGVQVLEVVFSDKTIWKPTKEMWKSVPKQDTLEVILQDQELINQYKIKFGNEAAFQPIKDRDIWLCTCGAVNRQEAACHICGNTLGSLFAENIMTELNADKELRLLNEEKQRLEKERRLEEKEQGKHDNRRTKRGIYAFLGVMLMLFLLIGWRHVLPTYFFDKARMYEEGDSSKGVEQDYSKAIEWYTKAAEHGEPAAMHNLALMYYKGEGTTIDYSKFFEWEMKAAEADIDVAMYNIGICYDWGVGVSKDYEKALEWYGKAYKAGYSGDAKGAIERLIASGRVTEDDAEEWLR